MRYSTPSCKEIRYINENLTMNVFGLGVDLNSFFRKMRKDPIQDFEQV